MNRAILSGLIGLGLGIVFLRVFPIEPFSVKRAAFINSTEGQRVRHLVRLNSALGGYYKKHKKYPITKGYQGIKSCWGASRADWISGVVPEFIDALPRDPTNNDNCSPQYLYKSNGKGYKLIAHKPPDFSLVIALFPELLDIRRRFHSYGFWTSEWRNL